MYRLIILVSVNIRCTQIFVGLPLGGGPQIRVGLWMTAIFCDLSGCFFGDRLRPAILCGDMLPLVGL